VLCNLLQYCIPGTCIPRFSKFCIFLKNELSEYRTLSRDGNKFKNHEVLADEEAAVLRSVTESTNLSISSPIENGNKESISETLRLDETDIMEKIRYE